MINVSRAPRVAGALAAVTLLAACSAAPSDAGPDPDAVDPAPPVVDDASGCLTGAPWSLNLPDYAEQAQTYMVGLGIPISEFSMSGSQTVQFTDGGLMSVLTDVTSAGTLDVPGVGPFPLNVHSDLGGSGDWSLDDSGMMTIQNWASLGSSEADPTTGAEVPVLDFSTIDAVGVTCQPGLLSLTAPDSPFVPLFTR